VMVLLSSFFLASGRGNFTGTYDCFSEKRLLLSGWNISTPTLTTSGAPETGIRTHGERSQKTRCIDPHRSERRFSNDVADRVQIQQVLMNLMLNGIEEITDAGGVVTVKSQLGEDSQIEISVNDTGPGLPLSKADHIFAAFFTTKPQGSGMGLAISKSIVESHGGRIWANGDGGRGATFHFTLPAAPTETNPPVDAA
jgi:signal transduction histidine kinase